MFNDQQMMLGLRKLLGNPGILNGGATLTADEVRLAYGIDQAAMRRAIERTLEHMPADLALDHVSRFLAPGAETAEYRLTPIGALLALVAVRHSASVPALAQRLAKLQTSSEQYARLVDTESRAEEINPPCPPTPRNERTIRTFDFDGHPVRTVVRAGDVWFVATDVASVLDYRVAGDMTRILDEDETDTHVVRTGGGDQTVTVISESGLYHALLKSRKPEAQPFRKWVTGEVLPQIRETGFYASNDTEADAAFDLDLDNLRFTEQTWQHLHMAVGGDNTRAWVVWRLLQLIPIGDWHACSLSQWAVDLGGAVRRQSVGVAMRSLQLLDVIEIRGEEGAKQAYRIRRDGLQRLLDEANQFTQAVAEDVDAPGLARGQMVLLQRRPSIWRDVSTPNVAQAHGGSNGA